jgi:hypothetical protein
MSKMSARHNFIQTINLKRLAAYAWDAMQLASSHDPDHAKELKELRIRIDVLERQLERIGVPQYRLVKAAARRGRKL